jgi:hypothetical protein
MAPLGGNQKRSGPTSLHPAPVFSTGNEGYLLRTSLVDGSDAANSQIRRPLAFTTQQLRQFFEGLYHTAL